MPALTTSLRWIDAEHGAAAVLGDDERRAAATRRSPSTIAPSSGGTVAALLLDPAAHRVGRALADAAAVVEVDAAHAGLRGERRRASAPCELAAARGRSAPWRGRRSSGPRASRRRGSRAAPRRRAPRSVTPGDRDELGRLPVAERDRAGLVEQQRRARRRPPRRRGRDIASTLRCTSRSMPAMPIAESSAADRGRDQADEQRDQHDRRGCSAPE